MNFSDMVNQISGNKNNNGTINITKDITGINVNEFKDKPETNPSSAKPSKSVAFIVGTAPSVVIDKEPKPKKDCGTFVGVGAVCIGITRDK